MKKCDKCEGSGYISIDEPFCEQCSGIGYNLSSITDEGTRKIWFYVFLLLRLKRDMVGLTERLLNDKLKLPVGPTAKERLEKYKQALEKLAAAKINKVK